MRIGIDLMFAVHNLNFGLGLFTKQLIEGLLALEDTFQYVLFVRKVYYDQAYLDFPSTRIEIVLVPDIYPFYKMNKHLGRFTRTFCSLPLKVKEAGIDIYLNTYGYEFAIWSDTPNISVIHDLHFKHFSDHYTKSELAWKKWRIGNLLKNSKSIVTISNYVKNDVLELYEFVDKDNVFVIGNPIEAAHIPGKQYNLPAKYILSVNSFTDWKNQITLLKAFLQIKDKIEHNIVLIGYNDTQKIRQFITDNNLDKRVTIKQQIDDAELYAWYASASLFVNTSLFEGFGRSNIEAGLLKVPILSSTEMCLEEVSLGLLEYYKPATDENILAQRIMECLDNKELYPPERLQNIKNKFEEEYNKIAIARKFLQVIEHTAAKKK